MEIAAFKDKYCILSVLIFDHSNLNILRLRSPFDANSILLDSWLKEISTYQISTYSKSSYERDMIFLRQPINSTTYRFCRNKSNLLKCRLFTLQRTIYIFFRRVKMDWRNVGIRISYQIKRKRERKGWGS